jgi:hypothetical protein
LARIYRDLGFEQLGVVEAARSLANDPANAAAHRFLADLYLSRPRTEVARVSELLQAQLLSGIDTSPLQPSLAVSDLGRTAIGGLQAGPGEFGSLFERDGAGLTATGVVGSEATLGEELSVNLRRRSGVLAFGQLRDETNGFRRDDETVTDVYDVLAQAAVTPALSVQAEYRFRETDRGDVELRFDPDLRTRERNRVNEHTGRLGARYAAAPGHTVIASGIATDRDERIEAPDDLFPLDADAGSQGGQLETQYLHTGEALSLRVGGGYYRFESTADIRSGDVSLIANTAQFTQRSAYAYADVRPFGAVSLTLGFQYDSFEQARYNKDRLSPKLGAQVELAPWVSIRGAYYGTLKRLLAADQTIEPVQVAGFNQLRDDLNGSEADGYALGLDLREWHGLAAGAEWHRRDLHVPAFQQIDRKPIGTRDQREDDYRLYAYWVLSDRWTLAIEPSYRRFELGKPRPGDLPEAVDTWEAPITARWFGARGLFALTRVTPVYQDVRAAEDGGDEQAEGDRGGLVIDAEVGWRSPGGRGRFAIEFDNLLDTKLHFRDENYLANEVRRSGVVPERTVLCRLSLDF